MRYLVWTSVVVLGALLAVVDQRIIGRWILGGLFVAGVVGGLLVTVISPFRFGGTSYYMEGVIVAGGSALALVGYVVARFAGFVWRRTLDGR
jgi:hypothetical protein